MLLYHRLSSLPASIHDLLHTFLASVRELNKKLRVSAPYVMTCNADDVRAVRSGHIIAKGDRAPCNPVTSYGVCVGTDEKPGMVMEATGFMLRHANHPKYGAMVVQIVDGAGG